MPVGKQKIFLKLHELLGFSGGGGRLRDTLSLVCFEMFSAYF